MREVTITRVYDAPRELVWRAWTEPERLAQWWGKRGWNAQLDSIVIDARPGGAFRVTTVNADGAEMTTEGVFAEVVAPERLSFAGGGSVTLTELPGGRTRMVFRTTVPHATAEGGVRSALDRLAEHLSPERTSP
ncbi:MAG TPA: SRPBCC domain-containing protein [Solirubrobacteraceae bacterium]|nr:SRPBCC domain-containing protein [Solirubrobacteraceae bacterium]